MQIFKLIDCHTQGWSSYKIASISESQLVQSIFVMEEYLISLGINYLCAGHTFVPARLIVSLISSQKVPFGTLSELRGTWKYILSWWAELLVWNFWNDTRFPGWYWRVFHGKFAHALLSRIHSCRLHFLLENRRALTGYNFGSSCLRSLNHGFGVLSLLPSCVICDPLFPLGAYLNINCSGIPDA